MNQERLDGIRWKAIIYAGYRYLEANQQHVNALNVFPIPDGDTGTNMSMTFRAGFEEMGRESSREIGKMANALAMGLLMGARGNSGVILSQLFRGFAQTVAEEKDVDVHRLVQALQNGVDTAYRAVVKPVEGTILTVAREAVKAAQATAQAPNATFLTVFRALKEAAERSLAQTPQLLPVLRQAGVVDSGGQGLVYIYQGFYSAIAEEKLEIPLERGEGSGLAIESFPSVADHRLPPGEEFGYCTECIIRLKDPSLSDEQAEKQVRQAVAACGTSQLIVAHNHLVKIHIHTQHPGELLERALAFGPLIKVKVDNMTEQHRHWQEGFERPPKAEGVEGAFVRKRFALVVVAAGEGFKQIFRSLGVDEIIDGGQTMNPSTEELLRAAEASGAEHVFLLPNNKNIIMAAEQAQRVRPERIHVIPARTLPQGIAAVLAYQEDRSVEENQKAMETACQRVRSAAVTRAVRDSHFQEQSIREGDYLGFHEGQLVAQGRQREETVQELLGRILTEEDELVTLFYGADVTPEESEKLVERLVSSFPHCEFELQYGGQPLYDYWISIE